MSENKVERIAASLIREFLKRKGLHSTYHAMEEEFPKSDDSISNRTELARCLHLVKLINQNQAGPKPYKSTLEVIVNHLIEFKLDESEVEGLHWPSSNHYNNSDGIQKSFGGRRASLKGLVIDDEIEGETLVGRGRQDLISRELAPHEPILQHTFRVNPSKPKDAARSQRSAHERRGRKISRPGSSVQSDGASMSETRNADTLLNSDGLDNSFKNKGLEQQDWKETQGLVHGRMVEYDQELLKSESVSKRKGRFSAKLAGRKKADEEELSASAASSAKAERNDQSEGAVTGADSSDVSQSTEHNMCIQITDMQPQAAHIQSQAAHIEPGTVGALPNVDNQQPHPDDRQTEPMVEAAEEIPLPTPSQHIGSSRVKTDQLIPKQETELERSIKLLRLRRPDRSKDLEESVSTEAVIAQQNMNTSVRPVQDAVKDFAHRVPSEPDGEVWVPEWAEPEAARSEVAASALISSNYDSLEHSAVTNNPTKPPIQSITTSRLIDIQCAMELKRLVIGSASLPLPEAWKQQSFTFCDLPDLTYGFVQHRPGPCGVLAVVQAALLIQMLFLDTGVGSKDRSATRRLSPSAGERCKHLAAAISRTLWRAGDEQAAILALPSGSTILSGGGRYKPDGLTETLMLNLFEKFDDLEEYTASNIGYFQDPAYSGVVLLVYSAALSRRIDRVMDDMDSSDTSLINTRGFCTQELVNLLVCGKAATHIFNDKMESPDGLAFGKALVGIPQRSEIGMLALSEHFQPSTVGTFLKTPKFPVWIVRSFPGVVDEADAEKTQPTCRTPVNHFTVVFCLNRELISDWKVERRFDLFYYDGLGQQEAPVRLTIDTTNRFFEPPTDEENISTLELCIRTKWRDACISWNGTEPVL